MGKKIKCKLWLPCEGCGRPVYLKDARYLELSHAEQRPICRRSGCYRLIKRHKAGKSAGSGGEMWVEDLPVDALGTRKPIAQMKVKPRV